MGIYGPFSSGRSCREGGRAGFSLVELMTVLAIISLMVAMAIPRSAMFSIKVLRAERDQNMRIIDMAARSYLIDHTQFGDMGGQLVWWGLEYDVLECSTVLGAPSNLFGNLFPDCSKLRYYYQFQGDYDHLTGIYENQKYTIWATSAHYEMSDGWAYNYGNKLPTRLCRKPSGYNVYFEDAWLQTQDGRMRAQSSGTDAMINCF